MIATTTYHDTYGGSLRSMTMDMMLSLIHI